MKRNPRLKQAKDTIDMLARDGISKERATLSEIQAIIKDGSSGLSTGITHRTAKLVHDVARHGLKN